MPPRRLAHALGLRRARGRTTLEMIDEIRKGLPVRALYRLASAIAPDDASFRYHIVPKATLARRTSRLTAEESDRLARLAGVWSVAEEVWGDARAARAFLFRAHPLLGGRKPIDVLLGTDLGARLVEDVLGRLRYGSAA
ncbi:MAG TPA: antitoxin Xre/MbcA/ParS toxin-binding domain-containing protein [Polyangia bacterium]|nr:antitoxin Xre/MbcA/ParS toxin-binding domain-containing protein [Polyangia bacterium]